MQSETSPASDTACIMQSAAFGARPAADLQNQVQYIVERYPVKTECYMHRDAEGRVMQCCTAAVASLESAVRVAESVYGVAGVLAFLRDTVHWGGGRADTWCQCLRLAKSLDCGASAAWAVLALAMSSDVREGRVHLGTVQVAFRSTSTASRRWLRSFSRHRNADLDWAKDDVAYHHCIGLVDAKTGHLRVWAFEYWFDAPRSAGDIAGVVAMQYTPAKMHLHVPTKPWLAESAAPHRDSVTFGEYAVPTSQWVTFLPPALALHGVTNLSPVPAPHVARARIDGETAQDATEGDRKTFDTSPIPSPAAAVADVMAGTPTVTAFAPALPPTADSLHHVTPTFFVSGLAMNSDSPCPGVGIARSLRRRFPASTIIGVDYSWESAGLCDPVFNETHFIGHWAKTKPLVHARDVTRFLRGRSDAFYIPSLDAEVDMLAETRAVLQRRGPKRYACLDRVLVPRPAALAGAAKPGITAAADFGMETPPYMLVDPKAMSKQDLHAFCVRHGFPVFAKGPEHEAVLCGSWGSLQKAVASLSAAWGDGVYVQAGEAGFGMGLTFSAYRGELVAAVLFEKTFATPARKGWGGRIEQVPAEMLATLRRVCRRLNWTGGAELEFLRTVDGRDIAIDWNPRFPAWIAGSDAAAGMNLPGALVQEALRQQGVAGVGRAPEQARMQEAFRGYFVRTLVELPMARLQPTVLQGPETFAVQTAAGKHPSRATDLSNCLRQLETQEEEEAACARALREADVASVGSWGDVSDDSQGALSEDEAVSMASEGESEDEDEEEEGESDGDDEDGPSRRRRVKDDEFKHMLPLVPLDLYEEETEKMEDGAGSSLHVRSDSSTSGLHSMSSSQRSNPASVRSGSPGIGGPSMELVEAALRGVSSKKTDRARANKEEEETKQGALLSEDADLKTDALSANDADPGSWVPPVAAQRETLRREIGALTDSPALLTAATPAYGLALDTVRANLRTYRRELSRATANAGIPTSKPCLSVKTQPHQSVLRAACEAGFIAECISMGEYFAARKAGFETSEILITGPAKWVGLPRALAPPGGDTDDALALAAGLRDALCGGTLAGVFADSVEDLALLVRLVSGPNPALRAAIVGVRLAPTARCSSRFGVDLSNQKALARTVDLLRQLPPRQRVGIHTHMASSHVGTTQWRGMARSAIAAVEALAVLSGRSVHTLDLGGGWHPHAMQDSAVQGIVSSVLREAADRIPGLSCIQVEPGKAISERAGACVTTVQTVRSVALKQRAGYSGGGTKDFSQKTARAAIVDACICDMGCLMTHAHPVLAYTDGRWMPLAPGPDVIMGRICMEWDVIASGVRLPEATVEGQRIMIAFAGAYDMSMSYSFGDGVGRDLVVV